MWEYRAQVINVHDGDTLTVTLDLGFRTKLDIKLRLYGVYAPELNQTGGKETREFAVNWLNTYDKDSEWPFIVTTHRLPKSDSEDMTFDRYVGTLFAPGKSLPLNYDVSQFVAANNYPGGIGG